MKTLKKSAIVLGLFGLLAGTTTLVRAQDYQNDYQDDGYSTGNISMQTFYDELSPYGTWIQDPQYGYVWRPDVDQNEFRPYYSNGRWAMTEYGNTWVSNYDWGWAPFHYGRWVINSYRQWIWLPDTTWGPAWVDWRSGDGYYGWAPMAPAISINLSFGRRYSVPEFCWNFIPQRNIYLNVFPRYDYGRNNVYIRNTTIINNTYVYNKRSYYGGPRMEDIRRATNRNVTVYRFDQSNRPGASRVGGREVSIYRPRPERNADNRNAAPRKFEQGNAGIGRGGRSEGYTGRDQRNNNDQRNGNNDNRFGSRNDNNRGQINRGGDANPGRENNQPGNKGEAYDRNSNGRASRGNTNGFDQRNGIDNRGQNQQAEQQRAQRNEQMQQQRGQQAEQQRAQRNEQMQQQRGQQAEQQRAQRNEQMQQQRNQQAEQQRAQRNEQMQQQRSQQAEQQRAQRNEQMQQQRNQQVEQQRAQRNEQMQQQRSQQAEQQRAQRNEQMQQRQEQRRTESAPQQRSGGEGRPSRGGRG